MKITGNKKFLLRERLETIKVALTIVPTSSCGCPIKKGTKKAMKE